MNAKKLTNAIALLGVFILLISILGRLMGFLPFDNRNIMLVVGLTCMLLGTIWKVVLEMKEDK